MNREPVGELKPFLSLVIIILTLFTVAFMKMEVRRLGYTVFKQTRRYKTLKDEHWLKTMEYARITRPDHIRHYAISRLTLNEARAGQIIQLVGERAAVRQ